MAPYIGTPFVTSATTFLAQATTPAMAALDGGRFLTAFNAGFGREVSVSIGSKRKEARTTFTFDAEELYEPGVRGSYEEPDVVLLPGGGAVAAVTISAVLGQPDLWVQRFDDAGRPTGRTKKLNEGDEALSSDVDLTPISGGFVAVSMSNREGPVVRFYNENLKLMGGTSTGELFQVGARADVAELSNGRVVLAYLTASGTELQLMSGRGAEIGSPIVVPGGFGFAGIQPKLAALSGGGVAAIYSTSAGATVQVFRNDLTAKGRAFTVEGAGRIVDIAETPDGALAIAWTGNRIGTDAFMAVYSASGTQILPATVVNSPTSGNQATPEFFTRGDGTLFLGYGDQQGVSGSYSSAAQVLEVDEPDKVFEGTSGNNSRTGVNGTDVMLGLGGNDDLNGAGGADLLRGGPGADTLKGGGGNDVLSGEAGSDRLDGGPGNDTLDGGDAGDRLNGGAGADSLLGGDGADTLLGGGGDDTARGGEGNDRLKLGGGSDSGFGDAGNDLLDGQSGNDTLEGGAGRDTLKGSAGFDILRGGSENDELRGGKDNDGLSGDDGNDKLYGEDGFDNLSGGEGRDTLLGGDGLDVLNGDAGKDVLNGGEGNDVLSGGLDDDNLRGGPGADRFLFTDSRFADIGRDKILDWESGSDSLDFRGLGLVLDDTLRLRDAGAGLVVAWDNGQVVIAGETVASFDTGDIFV